MPDKPRVRPFADFIREQNRGRTHEELSEAMFDLVAKVEDTGKKGTLTYVVTIEPLKGNEDALTVSDEIKLKLPEHDRGASIFFRGRDGNLQREDPDQPTFDFLREVPAPAVDPDTGEVLDGTDG